mmetsp:Transcript_32581/g.68558  ORF Transcript_32581/g.68558 Transcript_32581/m.68558 type:complete len:101 (-) Transcript_32581:428-730(-)
MRDKSGVAASGHVDLKHLLANFDQQLAQRGFRRASVDAQYLQGNGKSLFVEITYLLPTHPRVHDAFLYMLSVLVHDEYSDSKQRIVVCKHLSVVSKRRHD